MPDMIIDLPAVLEDYANCPTTLLQPKQNSVDDDVRRLSTMDATDHGVTMYWLGFYGFLVLICD
jgi:hypothetical protein